MLGIDGIRYGAGSDTESSGSPGGIWIPACAGTTIGWTRKMYVRGARPALAALAAAFVLSACTAPPSGGRPQSQVRAADTVPAVPDLDPAPRAGRPAPDFALADLRGNTVRLSDLRGKVVFINFWASWCGPCQQEMPEIEKVYQKYVDKGVVFLGVDIQESSSVVRQFVQRGGYNWTFLLDATGLVTSRYGVTAIPTSFFVDRNGVIREVYLGALDKRGVESRLSNLLSR